MIRIDRIGDIEDLYSKGTKIDSMNEFKISQLPWFFIPLVSILLNHKSNRVVFQVAGMREFYLVDISKDLVIFKNLE